MQRTSEFSYGRRDGKTTKNSEVSCGDLLGVFTTVHTNRIRDTMGKIIPGSAANKLRVQITAINKLTVYRTATKHVDSYLEQESFR